MKRDTLVAFGLGAVLSYVAVQGGGVGAPTAVAAIQDLQTDEQNTVAVFREAAPAVVYVESKALRRDLFTLNVMEIPQGSGSGFVWDRDGHVVTNFHVVQGSSALSVTLADGSVHEATVVGADPSKDLAVLKVQAPKSALQPLALGTSDELLVGQKVVAIGNPFGLDQTLTTGVISALGREIEAVNGRTIHDVVQTDAAINPGNSGGPLLDSAGRLIGVNTAIFSPTGTSSGIGFAVPVDTVARVVPELIAHGRVIRPALGVSLVHDGVAQRWGVSGVAIGAVSPQSAAAAAGLVGLTRGSRGQIALGDVIVGVEGRPVADGDALLTALEDFEVGQEVTLRVRRGGAERDVTVRLQPSS